MLLLSDFDLAAFSVLCLVYRAEPSYFVVIKGEDTMQKKLSFFLVFVLLFACLMTACGPKDQELDTESFSDETFRYVSYDDGWGIAAVEGLAQPVVEIPATVKERPVVRIEQNGFANNTGITTLTVPGTVKEIGISAFSGCTALATITMPESVELIGSEAFANTAFYNDAANWADDSLYLGKYLIKVKTSIGAEYDVKSGTLAIASHAFADRDDYFGYIGCAALKEVTFPSSLKAIGDGAFKNCKALETFDIPASVTYIGDYAFHNTAYVNQELNKKTDNPEEILDVLYIGKHLIQVNEEKLGESYTVASGTVAINAPAFADCEELTTVEIPGSVKRIGVAAFRNCTALTSIVFDGTEEEWNAISKGYDWDKNTGAYQITFKKVAPPETTEK